MKAQAIRAYKTPLQLMHLPRPKLGPSDVLVSVRARKAYVKI